MAKVLQYISICKYKPSNILYVQRNITVAENVEALGLEVKKK